MATPQNAADAIHLVRVDLCSVNTKSNMIEGGNQILNKSELIHGGETDLFSIAIQESRHQGTQKIHRHYLFLGGLEFRALFIN